MINFLFGLSLGTVVGAVGTFAAGILVAVIIEDSPEIRKTLEKIYND